MNAHNGTAHADRNSVGAEIDNAIAKLRRRVFTQFRPAPTGHHGTGTAGQGERRQDPQQQRVTAHRWVEQHPAPVPVRVVVQDLLVAAPGGDHLLDLLLDLRGGVGGGVGDRLALAHRAAQLLGEGSRPVLGRWGRRRQSGDHDQGQQQHQTRDGHASPRLTHRRAPPRRGRCRDRFRADRVRGYRHGCVGPERRSVQRRRRGPRRRDRSTAAT